jgi:hypothetical protein
MQSLAVAHDTAARTARAGRSSLVEVESLTRALPLKCSATVTSELVGWPALSEVISAAYEIVTDPTTSHAFTDGHETAVRAVPPIPATRPHAEPFQRDPRALETAKHARDDAHEIALAPSAKCGPRVMVHRRPFHLSASPPDAESLPQTS